MSGAETRLQPYASPRTDQPTANHPQRAAFTLVELLVVITIIGILVSLVTVAALGAIRTARQAAIKFEIDQISGAFEKYKDSANSYPPNLVVDGGSGPVDEVTVLADLKRHLQQAFPKHREPDTLIRQLVGDTTTPGALPGGMTAAEAVVFWLSGFSADPLYPISGEGGPSYPGTAAQNDPIESRKWKYEFDITRLGPRDDDGYFDGRWIQYADPRTGQQRRINFWTYTPGRSKLPVLYFDVSRHPAAVLSGSNVIGPYDPPAASDLHPEELHVHALKMRAESAAAGVPIRFANEGKFQILHCGLDDEWGEEILERTSAHAVSNPSDLASYLLFPTGPFTDATADTIANFVTPSRLEDAQQ